VGPRGPRWGPPRGDYVVDFNTNIPASCSWTATPYLDAASAAGGPTSAKALAAVAVRVAGDNESIRVWVFEIAAAPKQADSFVTVQVLC
jgi:hypothetical protein